MAPVQREREVSHDVGLAQDARRVAIPGQARGAAGSNEAAFDTRQEVGHDLGRHRQDAVRRIRLEVAQQWTTRRRQAMTWDDAAKTQCDGYVWK